MVTGDQNIIVISIGKTEVNMGEILLLQVILVVHAGVKMTFSTGI